MQIRTSAFVTLFTTTLFCIAGCNNQMRPPIEPRADPYGGRQIYLDSYQLQRDITVNDPTRSRDESGLMHVSLRLRSVIDRQLYIQYRVIFFDRNHSVVNEIGWTDKTLTANTPDQIDANSTSPSAEDFEIHLRYPPGF